MKTLNQIFGAALVAMSLSACGSNTNPYATSYNAFNNSGNGTAGYTGQPGCAPVQSGVIPFTVNGTMSIMNGVELLAGNLPQGNVHAGSYGQAIVGGSSMINQGGGMIQYSPKQSSDGTLQMSASQTGALSGTIQLSPSRISQIMANAGYNTGYNNGYNNGYNTGMNTMSQVCVTSIGLDIVQTLSNSGGYYGGYNGGYTGGYNQMMNTAVINSALVYITLNTGGTILLQI